MTDIWLLASVGLLALAVPAAAVAYVVAGRRTRKDDDGASTLLSPSGEGWCLNHGEPQWHARREECGR